MSIQPSRRRFIGGMLGGIAVLGFDPRSRSWSTRARAEEPLAPLPPLDGQVLTQDLEPYATDFGRIVSRTPWAVLVPGSIDDVVAMVQFCGTHGIEVAVNGQAGTDDMRESHSNLGQSQVESGLVIDISPLGTVHAVGSDSVWVDAGAHWADVFDAAEAAGLTPPVLTDYMHLSVGGTACVGGIGGATQHFGVQVDNILALEVVTGRGERVTCSATHRPLLFFAVLAGAGQCAIIVRAKVRLVPTKTNALVFNLFYDDLQTFLGDQLQLLQDGRFTYLEGQAIPGPGGVGWRYFIEAMAAYTPPEHPDQTALLSGLDFDGEPVVMEQSYRDFAFRLDPTVAFLKSIGVWQLPHPWLTLFLPASTAPAYLGNVLAGLTPADTGQGPVLIYPFDTRKTCRPLFRVPGEAQAFHLSILRTGSPDPAVTQAMLADNRSLYDQAVAVGGVRYIIGAIPGFSQEDWKQHYGILWPAFRLAKAGFDPHEILTPGQGIFSD